MSESLFEKFRSPPPPIDFAATKQKVRDQELIGMLESFYKANQPPPETYAISEAEKVATEQNIAYLTELDKVHKEFLPILEKEMEFQQTNRTTKDTTVFDMQVNYPLIHEEIEDELERREWFKDTGLVDMSRLQPEEHHAHH